LRRRFSHMVLPIKLFGFLPYQPRKSKEPDGTQPKQRADFYSFQMHHYG
jgi:hypothetical protein